MAVLVNASNFCFQIGNFQPTDQQRCAQNTLTLTLTLTLPLCDLSLTARGSPAPVQPCAYDGFGKTGGVSDEVSHNEISRSFLLRSQK